MAKFKIEGMKEIEKSIKRLGQVPQKCVTPAARKGMNIAIKSARNNAPVDKGDLRDGMKLIGEKARVKGKKVYQVVFDRAKNDIFQKKIKNDKIVKGTNKKGKVTMKRVKAGTVTGYYPASMEYGFFAKNGRYIPGYHFLKKAMESNSGAISQKIVDEMGKQIDKVLEGK